MRFLLVALVLCGPVLASKPPIAIVDITVVDVITAALHPHQTVLVSGDRITSIGAKAPVGARIVSGAGKFLIPGLWDMHVHLWYPQNQLPTFIAFGVTGVKDMGSDFRRTSAWRDAIEKGTAVGPHILTSGPPVDGQPSDDDKLPVIIAQNAREARAAFDQLWDLNVDFIKVLSGLSRDAYFALAEQARHWEVPLEGQIPTSVSAWDALEARQRSLEHLSGVIKSVSSDEEAIDFFEKCAVRGVAISPTLVLWQRMSHNHDEQLKTDVRLKYVPESIRNGWPELKDDDDGPSTRAQIDRDLPAGVARDAHQGDGARGNRYGRSVHHSGCDFA